MGVVTSIVSAAVAAGSTAKSIHEARKGQKAGKRANEIQKELNRRRNLQQKRAMIKQVRQQQAQILTGAVAAGVGLESSLTQGAKAGTQSALLTQISEFADFDAMGSQIADYRQYAANRAAKSAMFGQIANTAMSFVNFGDFGGKGDPRSNVPGADSGAVTSKPSIFNAAAGNT